MSTTNAYGESSLSDVIEGLLVETVPHKPSTTPMRGDLTTQTQLHVLINMFPVEENGGSSILACVLEWDKSGSFEQI